MIPTNPIGCPYPPLSMLKRPASIGAIFTASQVTKDSGPPFRWRISRQNDEHIRNCWHRHTAARGRRKGPSYATVPGLDAGAGRRSGHRRLRLELLHTQRRTAPLFAQARILRPSGRIGINLGMLGVLMFFLIYLYPLRKKWGWLGRMGNSRHWLDFHVVLGTAAPVIVAFHSTFKFGNIAGMAFYSMLMVTISGFVGRYLYAHIPRGLSAAELSMKEIQEKEEALRKELAEQKATFGFC